MDTAILHNPPEPQEAWDHPEKHLLDHLMFEKMQTMKNPYITVETLVLRVIKDLAKATHVPWNNILELLNRPCVLDPEIHGLIKQVWDLQKRNTTLDEQQMLERVLGHDHVKSADIVKLATYVSKVDDKKLVYVLFAMDNMQGNDPKNYVDNFKNDDIGLQHVRAVRKLYEFVDTPEQIQEIVEMAFDYLGCVEIPQEILSCVDLYVRMVPRLSEVKKWKFQQIADSQKPKKTVKRKKESDVDLTKVEEETPTATTTVVCV